MDYSKGDFVKVKGIKDTLYIIRGFEYTGDPILGRLNVELCEANSLPTDSSWAVGINQLVKATRRFNHVITPFQRGLLRSIKCSDIPAWQYRHFKATVKRSINCLIKRGFVELFDDTEPAPNGTEIAGKGVRVTWAGRRVDVSN